jgi:hypothetical protein
LEAKACMTAHQRALPRLYDELNSSHLTVHGATDEAIAAGFVMVNIADRFVSPDRNRHSLATSAQNVSKHNQPRDASLVVSKVAQIPRRSGRGESGFDAISIMAVNCVNDGSSITEVKGPPAPEIGDIFHYESMIERVSHLYASRFTLT